MENLNSAAAAERQPAANLLQICCSGEACCDKKEFVGGEELGNRGFAAAGERQPAGDLLQEQKPKTGSWRGRGILLEWRKWKMENGKSAAAGEKPPAADLQQEICCSRGEAGCRRFAAAEEKPPAAAAAEKQAAGDLLQEQKPKTGSWRRENGKWKMENLLQQRRNRLQQIYSSGEGCCGKKNGSRSIRYK
jgi:hypothetical protein